MSNQNDVDRILKERGYVHPEKSGYTGKGSDPYSTYTEGETEGDCYVQKRGSDVYAKFSYEEDLAESSKQIRTSNDRTKIPLKR
jgi:hypothetical protein